MSETNKKISGGEQDGKRTNSTIGPNKNVTLAYIGGSITQGGWVHCNPLIILDEEESELHTVRIQMKKGDEDRKFTILGFGIIM